MQHAISTAQALSLTSITPFTLENMTARRQFKPPPASPGRPRMHDRDDVAALFVLDHYYQLGVRPGVAGSIATEFRAVLRRTPETHETLWVVATASGKPVRVVSVEPANQFRHEFPIAQLRAEIERIVLEKFGVQLQ